MCILYKIASYDYDDDDDELPKMNVINTDEDIEEQKKYDEKQFNNQSAYDKTFIDLDRSPNHLKNNPDWSNFTNYNYKKPNYYGGKVNRTRNRTRNQSKRNKSKKKGLKKRSLKKKY